MSIVEPDRSPTRKFLQVICPCGRALRAPVDMAGQEIVAGNAIRMVRVPVPRSTERAYRVITEGLHEVFEARWLGTLFVGAAALTAALCVPGIGIPLGTLVLDPRRGRLRRADPPVRDRRLGLRRLEATGAAILRASAIATLVGLSVAAPMLLSRGGFGQPRGSPPSA